MTPREPGPRWVPLGEQLIEALRDEIAAARSEDPVRPVTVIVPSFYSALFLRRRLAADAPLFNVQFQRLEEFADALAAPADERPPLTRLRAAEIIHAVATDPSATLPPVFERIRGQDGFHRALHRTLDDLDAAGADPDVLGRGRDWKHTAVVAGLWRRYRARADAFAGASDSTGAAAEAVRASAPALKRFGVLVLLLVEEPAPQHRELVSALVDRPATRVLVGATGEHESDGLMSQIPGVPPPGEDPGTTDRPMRDEYRLVSVPDPAEEVRWVVRDVLAAAREGTPFGRVGVFFESPSYGARLTEAFELSGVPVAGPSPDTLAQTPGGRWIRGLLAVLDSGFARDRLAAWVTGSKVIAADGRPAPGARWDVISRRAGVVTNVVDGEPSWDGRLGSYAARLRTRAERAARQDDGDESARSRWRADADESDRLRAFVQELAAEGSPPETTGPGASWTSFVAWLKSLAERYGGPRAETGPGEDDDEAGRAVGATLEALKDLDSIDLPPPTFERFRRTLELELDRPLPRMGRLGHGVFVAPLRQAVGCDFDRIYVTGMAEGSYPAIGVGDPLLPDAVRSGVPGLKTLGDERASARRRYLTALGTAPKRVLLWPRSQTGATRLVWPARWFAEAAELVSGRPLSTDLLHDENSPLEIVVPAARAAPGAAPTDRYEYELRSLAAWRDAGRDVNGHFLFSALGGTLRAGRELEAGRFRSRRFTKWDGDVGDAPGWSPASLAGIVSPTRLESWAACPFRYFLTYEVAVEPTEAPETAETLSALDRGILVHDILDRFVTDAISNPPRGAEQDAARLQEIARERMDEFQRSGLTGRPVMWRLERERIRRGLLDFLDVHRTRVAERDERPVATELGFGDGEEVPAVILQLPGDRTVRFRGWIDRVDVNDDGTRATVIDYKSGRAEYFSGIKIDPVDGGHHLQLPLYALAVKGWRPEVERINAEFWFVMDAANPEPISTTIEDSVPRLQQVVGEIIEGIESGVFPAYPGEGSLPLRSGGLAPKNCAYCPFDRICPGGRAWAWERKASDQAAARFVGLSRGGTQ